MFLRAIGLGIIVSTYHGLFRKDFSEPTKVAIRRSRVTALLRTSIHVIPMGVALTEIILNLKGHYVGPQFSRQSVFQFAAKAHELSLLASLATVVLSCVRHEISFGNGIPFGAFLSGLQFSQVSYLWSTELWSALLSSSKTFHWKRKLTFLAVTVPCIVIAAMAGPSSATLLIPRKARWPANPTRLSVNGTFQDIWPDKLDGTRVPGNCAMVSGTSADMPCPWLDWQSFLSGLKIDAGDTVADFESTSHHNEIYFPLGNDNAKTAQKITQSLLCTSSAQDQFCASAPQEILSIGMNGDLSTWETLAQLDSFEDSYHEIRENYYQPYTIASCVADFIDGTNKNSSVQFAQISETESELKNPRAIVPLPELKKSQILETPGNISEYRLKWVELPQDVFNSMVIGVVVLNPRGASPDSPQNITTCTLGAGWGTSTVRTDTLELGSFYSTIVGTPASWPLYTFMSGESELQSDPNFANISGFQYPQRRIDVSPRWAEYLNPVISSSDGENTTVFNELLSTSPTHYNEAGIAKIIGIMLSSGLGRNGADLGWQALPNNEKPGEDCLVFTIEHSLDGWSYNIQDTARKLALVVMLVYCIIAFSHILYSLVSGISSTAWDSTAEVVALAMNSSPTDHLQNTCAGIIGVKTFRTPVRILASKMNDAKEEGHLELVFGDEKERGLGWSSVETNVKYGRVKNDGEC